VNSVFKKTPSLSFWALVWGAVVMTCIPLGASENWWDQLKTLPAGDEKVETVINRLIAERLIQKGITPAAKVAAATGLRRALLDLCGRIPTVPEMDAFLADASPDRWEKKVDSLVASAEFNRFLAHELNWLLMDGKSTEFQKYLTAAVEKRASWDGVFRAVISGQPNEGDLKGVDFYLRERLRDLDQMTNDVSVQFFGVNISCAQCHDHPYVTDWTQETYYGMRAFFTRTFETGGFAAERAYGEQSYKTTKGVEKKAQPRFLGGETVTESARNEPGPEEKKAELAVLEEFKKKKQSPPPPDYSRRSRLIEAALGEEERLWLARSLVNRTWFRLFGHGLVMPLDQMHGQNAPSHPELLQWLARDLASHDFDLRRLIRGIVLSEAYQRDSQWENGERPALSEFAVAQPRALTPLQYAAALKIGATRTGHFDQKLSPGEFQKRIDGTAQGGAGLARWFARPGENFHVAVDEALLFSNSGEIKGQLLNAGLRDEMEKLPGHGERISLAYRALLSREPDPEEVAALESYLAARADRPREGIEQILWAIMAGAEARFNH